MWKCPKCDTEIPDDTDFWVTLTDYSDKNTGRRQWDIPVCESCLKQLVKELEQ